MKTSEVLYAAADHIEKYGHHKGAGYHSEGSPWTAPACMIGAVNAEVYALTGTWENKAALAAVREHIGPIVEWNDAPERTAAEVVEALRAAAVIEAARESEARILGDRPEPVEREVAVS